MVTDDQRQSRPKPDRQVKSAPLDLGRHVTSLLNVVTKVLSDELDAYNVSPLEYSLLRMCLERGECTATEIAEELPIDASRVSRLVNGLVEDGMLVRRRLKEDRRIVMLRLSDQGQESTALLFQRIQAHYSRLTKGVTSAERTAFEAVMKKIIGNYAADEQSH